MNKETLAAQLTGRQIGNEITTGEAIKAADWGLVVAFGASDDLTRFEGAIEDEVGCGLLKFTKKGVFHDEDDDEVLEKYGVDGIFNSLESHFADGEETPDGRDTSWYFTTDIPHAKFDVFEDGELFCIGIVFSVADLV